MFSVVQFVQIALNFPALLSRQLDCIGKDAVACLLHVETPCVVGRGVFEENVALPRLLQNLGFDVLVIDSKEGVEAFIQNINEKR